MPQEILNQSWRQYSTKQQLYGPLPFITKTIQVRRTRHTGHCWRSKNELVSDITLWWTSSHWWEKAGRPARTYIQHLCSNTGCSLEDLPWAMDDRDGWRERVMEICAGGATWWYIYIYIHKLLNVCVAWYTLLKETLFNGCLPWDNSLQAQFQYSLLLVYDHLF